MKHYGFFFAYAMLVEFNHQFPLTVLCPPSFLSLNSAHLALSPAVAYELEKYWGCHKGRQDFREGWLTVNKERERERKGDMVFIAWSQICLCSIA
jgi:hypothetical protein